MQKKNGFGSLDAPVSGGQAGAENGALTVMIGGDQTDFDKAKDKIDCYSKKNEITRWSWQWTASQNGKPNLYCRISSGFI